MAGERVEIVLTVAPREDAGVDGRMQRLHPAVEQLGEAGEIGDGNDWQAGGRQSAGGAAGGDDLDGARVERAREIDESGAIGNADEGALGTHGRRAMDVRSGLQATGYGYAARIRGHLRVDRAG